MLKHCDANLCFQAETLGTGKYLEHTTTGNSTYNSSPVPPLRCELFRVPFRNQSMTRRKRSVAQTLSSVMASTNRYLDITVTNSPAKSRMCIVPTSDTGVSVSPQGSSRIWPRLGLTCNVNLQYPPPAAPTLELTQSNLLYVFQHSNARTEHSRTRTL